MAIMINHELETKRDRKQKLPLCEQFDPRFRFLFLLYY